jgi:phosphate/sulfate permease
MANLAFSIGAAFGTLTVSVLSAVKGAWVVTAVFGLLAAGFVMRATERYWRGPR